MYRKELVQRTDLNYWWNLPEYDRNGCAHIEEWIDWNANGELEDFLIGLNSKTQICIPISMDHTNCKLMVKNERK